MLSCLDFVVPGNSLLVHPHFLRDHKCRNISFPYFLTVVFSQFRPQRLFLWRCFKWIGVGVWGFLRSCNVILMMFSFSSFKNSAPNSTSDADAVKILVYGTGRISLHWSGWGAYPVVSIRGRNVRLLGCVHILMIIMRHMNGHWGSCLMHNIVLLRLYVFLGNISVGGDSLLFVLSL